MNRPVLTLALGSYCFRNEKRVSRSKICLKLIWYGSSKHQPLVTSPTSTSTGAGKVRFLKKTCLQLTTGFYCVYAS